MKLIIDVENDYYEMLKYNVEHGQDYKPFEIIANGIPYEATQGDLISREALKKKFERLVDETIPYGGVAVNDMRELIDNAPTVTPDKIQAIMSDYLVYRCEPQKPQGECETCNYHNFTQAIINGIVELISKNGITTIEELLETLKGGAE